MRTITNPDNYRSPDYRQILRIEKTGQSITESSVLEGSFTFDSTMVEGDVFQIGTAIADQITVTLTEDLDIDSYYDIYISALQSGAARNTATWVKLGTYVISDMDTSYEGQTKVVFQDKLVTLDESVLLNTGTLYANLTAMATVSLTQEEQTFLSGISVANAQTMTKRDFIRGCGLLMWENAYITSSGAVSYRIRTTTSQSFGPSVRFNSALADPVTIGPVDVVDDSGAVIFTRGSSSGQRIVIDNSTSPMINLIGGVENLAQYYSAATIPGRGIVGFEYTPLTMTAMSSWQMEPGDVFTYVDKNNVSHTSICTSVAHVLNGASACTSTAQSKQRQSKLIPSQTDEARAIVENLSSGIDIAQSTASEAMPKYGTCSTAASTVTKSVTGISNFNLQLGTRVSLLMTNSNTANEPKLNVNSTGAKYIVTSDGSKLTTSTNGIKAWLAGSMVTFVYTRNNDDTDYVWRIDDNYALTRINHIWADDLVGTNGTINLSKGEFNFGSGKLVWDGSSLSVTGTITSSDGSIGGFTIDATSLRTAALTDTTSGAIGISSADFTRSINGTSRSGLRFAIGSDFGITKAGKLYANDVNISGIISGSQIGGSYLSIDSTIGTSNRIITTAVNGEIQIFATNSPNSSGLIISDSGRISVTATDEMYLSGKFYSTGNITTGGNFTATGNISATGAISSSNTITSGGNLMVGDKRTWTDANSGVIATTSGLVSMRAEQNVSPGIFMTAYGSTTTTYDAGFYYNATEDRLQATKKLYVSGQIESPTGIYVGSSSASDGRAFHITTSQATGSFQINSSGTIGIYDSTLSKWVAYLASSGYRGPVASTTENGFMSSTDKTKLDALNANGYAASATTISDKTLTSGTTMQNIGSFSLTAGYWLVYITCRFGENSTGRRCICLATTSTGNGIDYASYDMRPAISGSATYMRIVHFLHPTETTTYYVNGYQNSGSSLAVITRYGAWKISS